MTLLITLAAAILSTLIWYNSVKARTMRSGMLCYMYWGASLMWLVDAAVEYFECGIEYFTPDLSDVLNDTFLGVSVVILGLLIWVIKVVIADPCGTIKQMLINQKR